MRVSIDETGRQRFAIGVNLAIALRCAKLADGNNTVALDADIGAEPRPSKAVKHGRITDDQVAAERHRLVPFLGLVENA